jgi:hypothetical protein
MALELKQLAEENAVRAQNHRVAASCRQSRLIQQQAHNEKSNRQPSKIGHNSGKIIDLEEKEEEVRKSIDLIDSSISALRSDNNIDNETREASVSSLESAKQNFLNRGKHYVHALLDPILIGLKNALEKTATEITKTNLMEALKWFSKILGNDS